MRRSGLKRSAIKSWKSIIRAKWGSYILRAEVILLYFYCHWLKVRLNGGGSFDGFVAETNSMLSDCGFQSLYAGNLYDCVFMLCASCSSAEGDNSWLYTEIYCVVLRTKRAINRKLRSWFLSKRQKCEKRSSPETSSKISCKGEL